MAQKATATRLSAWRLAGDGYDLWFGSFGLWLRAAALPFVLLILIDYAMLRSLAEARQAGGPEPLAHDLRVALGIVVDAIIYTLLGVSWHRWALLSERPRLLPAIGSEHLRFMAWALALMFLSQFAAGTVMSLVLAIASQSFNAILAGALAAFIVSLYFIARMSVIYPAAALGQRLGLLGAWQMTRKQGWALFWAYILVCIPLIAIFLLLGAFFGAAILGAFVVGMPPGELSRGWGGELAWLLPTAFAAFFSLGFLTLPVGVASSAYRRLSSAAARPPSLAGGTITQ